LAIFQGQKYSFTEKISTPLSKLLDRNTILKTNAHPPGDCEQYTVPEGVWIL